MRKIFLVTIAVILAVPLCFAQEQSTEDEAKSSSVLVSSTQAERKVSFGKVESVISGDADRGQPSKLVIKDTSDKPQTFVITPETTIADKQGNNITLDQLLAGNPVRVRYFVNEQGVKEALLIRIRLN